MPVYTRKVYVLNGSILFGTEEGVEVDFENIRERVKAWAHWCLGEDVELVEEDPECFTVVTERTIALNNCWEKI